MKVAVTDQGPRTEDATSGEQISDQPSSFSIWKRVFSFYVPCALLVTEIYYSMQADTSSSGWQDHA